MKKIIFTIMVLAVSISITAQITRRGGHFGNARWDIIGDALVITTTSTNPITIGANTNSYQQSTYPWHNYRADIKTLIIGENVSNLGKLIFADMPNLSTVILPKNLLSIGIASFYRCNRLRTITLRENLNEMRGRAFESCSYLESVNIHSYSINAMWESVNSIFDGGDYFAFPAPTLPRFKTLHLGSTVVSLPTGAFYKLPLEHIYSYADLPPTTESRTFYQLPSGCELHVRPEHYDAYMEVSPWNTFVSSPDITNNMFTIVSAEVGSEYGSISPRGDHNLAEGGNYRYTFEANPGYRVGRLIVDGVSVHDSIPNGGYTFNNLNKNHYIYVEFSIQVGLDTPEAGNLSLSPSVATDFVNISLTHKPIDNIVVCNSVGTIVAIKHLGMLQNNFTLDTSSLPAGVYMVVVNNEYREKFIKF